MKLTVLGCAGTFPGPGSPCSSYVIEHEGYRLLIDAGNGALGPLQQHIGLLGINAVLVSHLHGDHCLDLVAYSYALRYNPEGPLPRMPVYGPVATRHRLCGAFDDWPSDGLSDVFDFRGIRAGTRAIGPFEIELDRVRHPIEAYGVRVTAGGRTFTYSGDTSSCKQVEHLAREADLFLCESSWAHSADNPPGIHMSGRDAGEAAHRAGARRLLLTHMVPWADKDALHEEAVSQYEGDIACAASGESYDV
jgi:ribonuclease BN (tRNA processing enzyme)